MTTNNDIIKQTTNNALKSAVEQAVTAGNLSALTPPQRLYYYNQVCESMGLNPLTRPMDFIQLNGKLVLYVKKDGTDQLRKIHGVSITKVEQAFQEGCCVVTAYARDKNGKEDSDVGAVPLIGLKGDAYANAIMKAVTKSKRRVTLSISGLGLLDESELDGVQGVTPDPIDLSARSSQQVETLKEKLLPAQDPPVKQATNPPAREEAPKAKPGRPAKAKPIDVQPEPQTIPTTAETFALGDTVIVTGEFKGKRFDDLSDAELEKLSAWVKHGRDVEKWSGPMFSGLATKLEAYLNFIGSAPPVIDEPDSIPPPPPEAKDDLDTFFSTPSEETPATSPIDAAIARIKHSKNRTEFDVACAEFKKSAKDLFKGMNPNDANAKLKEAQAVRDQRKAELQ